MRHYRALGVDLGWVALSPFVALVIRDNFVFYEPHWDAIVPYSVFTVAAGTVAFGAIRPHKTLWQYTSLPDMLRIAAAVTITIFLALFLGFVTSRLDGVARSIPVIQWFTLTGALMGTRVIARMHHERRRRVDLVGLESSRQHVLIIGVSHVTELYLESLGEYAGKRLEVVGLLSDQRELRGRLLGNQTVLGSPEELPQVISRLEVHGVTIDRVAVMEPFDQLSRSAADAILTLERGSDIKVDWLLERLGLTDEISQERLNGVDSDLGSTMQSPQTRQGPSATKIEPLSLGRYGYVKRAADLVLAAMLTFALAPVAIAVALLVAIDVGFPVVFWQKRPGRSGQSFRLYKFCTMGAVHDHEGNRVPDEYRSTMVGGLLRRTRVDELPQLYNILIGEMSFIGPRPLLPCDQPDDRVSRLSVRPGLTGLAQVHGDRNMSPNDKNALDIWYIQNASLWLDIKIMLRTMLVFVRGERVDLTMLQSAREAIEQLNSQDAVRPLMPSV